MRFTINTLTDISIATIVILLVDSRKSEMGWPHLVVLLLDWLLIEHPVVYHRVVLCTITIHFTANRTTSLLLFERAFMVETLYLWETSLLFWQAECK